MKSRIIIDLDYDNQPIISIDYQPSEDVRDKMVKRFLEHFASESIFCSIKWAEDPTDTVKIRSISPSELHKYEPEFNKIIEENRQVKKL